MADERELEGSPIYMGAEEVRHLSIDTTEQGGSPTDVSQQIYDITYGTREEADLFADEDAEISGDQINLPALSGPEPRHIYRGEVKYTCGGQVWERWFILWGRY
jgi:hypothetical protein